MDACKIGFVEQIKGWMNESMKRWMNIWIDVRTNGWISEGMDDGLKNKQKKDKWTFMQKQMGE